MSVSQPGNQCWLKLNLKLNNTRAIIIKKKLLFVIQKLCTAQKIKKRFSKKSFPAGNCDVYRSNSCYLLVIVCKALGQDILVKKVIKTFQQLVSS